MSASDCLGNMFILTVWMEVFKTLTLRKSTNWCKPLFGTMVGMMECVLSLHPKSAYAAFVYRHRCRKFCTSGHRNGPKVRETPMFYCAFVKHRWLPVHLRSTGALLWYKRYVTYRGCGNHNVALTIFLPKIVWVSAAVYMHVHSYIHYTFLQILVNWLVYVCKYFSTCSEEGLHQ